MSDISGFWSCVYSSLNHYYWHGVLVNGSSESTHPPSHTTGDNGLMDDSVLPFFCMALVTLVFILLGDAGKGGQQREEETRYRGSWLEVEKAKKRRAESKERVSTEPIHPTAINCRILRLCFVFCLK